MNGRNLGSLPKWARQEILGLRAGIEYRDEQARRAVAGETEVAIRDYAAGGTKIGLEPGSRIVFTVLGGEIECWVDPAVHALEIMGYSGRLLLSPDTTNVVRAEVRRYGGE